MRRLILKSAAGLIVLIAVLGATLLGAQEQTAKGLVEGMLQDILSGDGRDVVVEDVSIAVSGDVTARRVEVRDDAGAWLVLEGLNLDWQPLSLLSESLEIDAVTVERIAVSRLPEAGETEVGTPQELSGLTNANITRLEVERLELAEALAGQAAVLRIEGTGRVRQSPPEAAFDIAARRIDGTDGELTARALIDPVSRGLSLELELHEPAGGFAVNLLNIRGTPRVDMAMTADGTLDNWTGAFTLDLDGTRTLNGNATGRDAKTGKRLNVEAAGDLSRLVPVEVGNLLGGSAELVAAAVFKPGGGAANIERIRLGNDALQLRLAGPVDWTGDGSDLSIELRSLSDGALTLYQASGADGPVTASGLNADARITGNMINPKWAFTALAEAIDADAAAAGKLRLDLNGQGVAPATGPVSVAGTLEGELHNGRKDSLPPVITGPLKAELSLRAGQDSKVELTRLDVSAGEIDADARGTLDTGSGAYDIAASARTSSPATGVDSLDRLLAGSVNFSGELSSAGDGTVILKGTKLIAKAVRAELSGSLSATDQDLRFLAAVSDLSRLNDNTEGNVAVSGSVTGTRAAPHLKLTGGGEAISLLDRPLTEPSLVADLTLSRDKPSGTVSFTGRLDGRPVSLNADIASEADGTRVLKRLIARAGDAELSGQLRLPRDESQASGRFTVAVPDLADIAPFLLSEASGSLNGEVVLDHQAGEGRLTASFNGDAIELDDIAAAALTADIRIADPLGAPRPSGTARLDRVRAGGMSFSAIDLDAKETGADSFDVALKAAGSDLSIDAQAAARLTDAVWTIDVNRLSGAAQGIAFRSSAPFQLQRTAAGAVSVSDARLAIGNGQVSARGNVSPDLGLDVVLRSVPLNAFARIASLPGLAGTLDGEARLTGRTSRPDGTFRLAGAGVTFGELRAQGLKPVSFTTRGRLSRGTIDLNGTAKSGGALTSDISGTVVLGPPARLDLRINGRSTGKAFTDRLARDGVRFEGDVRFAVSVRGLAAAPFVEGNAQIARATLGDAEGKFIVRNATGRVLFDRRRVRIENLSGTTGRKGRARVNGDIQLDGGLTSNLAVRVDDGVYTDGTLVSTIFDARLVLTGPLTTSPLVRGEIRLKDTKITLSEVPPSALQPLEVRHARAPAPVRRQAQWLRGRAGGAASSIRLDILVVAADPISISGRGLNVTLGGKLRLTGPLSEPRASGAFRLRRGSMSLLARRLEFESGRLDFFNDLDPRINLVAVSRRTDATIRLVLSGRASTPEISVTASPEMPQEEALARLIFDRSMLELSPLQIAQLAAALSTLSGGGDGGGILGGLQNALGLDWVEITETPDGETAVGVGKRLNDRLSIGVEQTTQTNTSRVIIDLDITKNLKLRGAAGTDGSSRAGIFFEKDY